MKRSHGTCAALAKLRQDDVVIFLRLGDPQSLSLYVASLTYRPDILGRLFDNGRVRRLYFHDARTGLALGAQPLFEQAEHGSEREGCLAWLPLRHEVSG